MTQGFNEQEVLEVDICSELSAAEIVEALGGLADRLEADPRRLVLIRCSNETPVGPDYAVAIREFARRGTRAGVRYWAIRTPNWRKQMAVDRLMREGAGSLAEVCVSVNEEAVLEWCENRLFSEQADAGLFSRRDAA